ncbi:MAG: transglycosylase SLT domain-containing protein [Bacteroidales bacterium]|nr:transglycosylase SLT domain-containing protein [Bacteroidales bacterium]
MEFLFYAYPDIHPETMEGVKWKDYKCSISIEGSMYSSRGNPVGFSYEMLNALADAASCNVDVLEPVASPACIDSLVDGSRDIVVMYEKDAEEVDSHKNMIFRSIPLKNDIVFVVSADNAKLINAINLWLNTYVHGRQYKLATNRYFRNYKIDMITNASGTVSSISPYDDIIRKYCKFVGLDWKLMTALIYQESRFYTGAQLGNTKGLVQMKESTARKYGVEDLYDPELSIKAGTLHLKYLFDMYINEPGVDTLNAMKFALASYNAGEYRIQECIAHAAEEGVDFTVWDSVATTFGTMPNFKGTQTIKYVDNVMAIWEQYKNVEVK